MGKGRPFGLLTDPGSFWGGGRREEEGGGKKNYYPGQPTHTYACGTGFMAADRKLCNGNVDQGPETLAMWYALWRPNGSI